MVVRAEVVRVALVVLLEYELLALLEEDSVPLADEVVRANLVGLGVGDDLGPRPLLLLQPWVSPLVQLVIRVLLVILEKLLVEDVLDILCERGVLSHDLEHNLERVLVVGEGCFVQLEEGLFPGQVVEADRERLPELQELGIISELLYGLLFQDPLVLAIQHVHCLFRIFE